MLGGPPGIAWLASGADLVECLVCVRVTGAAVEGHTHPRVLPQHNLVPEFISYDVLLPLDVLRWRSVPNHASIQLFKDASTPWLLSRYDGIPDPIHSDNARHDTILDNKTPQYPVNSSSGSWEEQRPSGQYWSFRPVLLHNLPDKQAGT